MLQRTCDRGSFLSRLRSIYVDAIISSDRVLKEDATSWSTLLVLKGSQYHADNAKKDFKGAFKMEVETNLMTEDEWYKLMRK